MIYCVGVLETAQDQIMTTTPPDPEQAQMSLGEHLEELRRRLIYALLGLGVAMAVTLVFTPRMVAWLKGPYLRVMEDFRLPALLATTTVGGGFDIYLRVAFYAGLILSAPWVFYQLWLFVAAGLLPRERRYVLRAVPLAALLFVGGAVFCVLTVAVPTLKFFIWVNHELFGLHMVITLDDYIQFLTTLMLAFGLCFQTPLAISLLVRVGLVSLETLRRVRKHVAVVILVIAAVLTPPDVFSQVALGIPMYLLYELGLLLGRLGTRKRLEEAEAG
ncbi:MAG TPA: twin-arginine translocase subunit TatC [Phycisphaerales bacterium]|nr:twin-arginine translocase subunit TatC [Phycisphaerales bacterium]